MRKKHRRKQRFASIRPIFFNRIEQGESMLVRELRQDPEYHHRYFRMNSSTFEELLGLVAPMIERQRCHSRPIRPLDKLAVTLRYLASGSSQFSLSMSYRLSPSSVSKLLRETMEAVCAVLEPDYLPVPSGDSWVKSEEGFNKKWNFPNCCGAVDGKHIRIRAPNHSGSQNFNYKGFFSLVLLGVVDSSYKFIAVDIGASGSQSDGGVLSRSAIGIGLENQTINLPADKAIHADSGHLPFVLVGDEAFPLKKYLMRPFPGKSLTVQRRIYNYRLSRARMVVENTFGILAARWRIFLTEIYGDPDFIKLIIKTCVVLHNYLINKKDLNGITVDSDQGPGNWRSCRPTCDTFSSIQSQGSNNYTLSASTIRDKFTEYFNGVGSVEWQTQMI